MNNDAGKSFWANRGVGKVLPARYQNGNDCYESRKCELMRINAENAVTLERDEQLCLWSVVSTCGHLALVLYDSILTYSGRPVRTFSASARFPLQVMWDPNRTLMEMPHRDCLHNHGWIPAGKHC